MIITSFFVPVYVTVSTSKIRDKPEKFITAYKSRETLIKYGDIFGYPTPKMSQRAKRASEGPCAHSHRLASLADIRFVCRHQPQEPARSVED